MDVAVKEWPDSDLFPIEYTTAELRAMLASEPRIWLVGYPASDWHPRPDPLEPLLSELQERPELKSQRFAYFGGPFVTLLGPPT